MVQNESLLLDDTDPRVIAAVDAEGRLFAHYGFTAAVRFVPLPMGIRVRVVEVGPAAPQSGRPKSGNPIVIVPGNTGDGFPFIPLLPELKGRQIIIINRPGGGLSEGMDHRRVDIRHFAVETLTAVFDALGLVRVPVIAHSMGGHWSLWFAMDRPERVASLCLLGVPGNVIDTCAPPPLRLASIPGINRLLFRLITPKAKDKALKGLSFMGHSARTVAALPPEMADCYFHFQRLPHYAVSSLSLMEKTNTLTGSKPEVRITAEQLGTVRQPVLMLWGEHDPFGSVEAGRTIAGALPGALPGKKPGAEFHLIPNGGHLPWLDDPAVCGNLITDFLSKNE
jgi:pimeloyl-ACP methyl ester carboxylesterase